MKLEQTVCSLELAKQLKKLRVPQESLFYWNFSPAMPGEPEGLILRDRKCAPPEFKAYSAFTVAELGEMLCTGVCESAKTTKPKYGKLFQQDKCPKWEEGDKMWALYLAGDEVYTFDDSEADARARFLVCLLERKIVKIKDLKGV